MKSKLATLAVAVASAAVLVPAISYAAPEASAKTFVKDSAITTKIKAKLAAEHVTSLAKIQVETDADGMVWLGGTARTQADADKAVMIARNTDKVRGVKSDIVVKPDN